MFNTLRARLNHWFRRTRMLEKTEYTPPEPGSGSGANTGLEPFTVTALTAAPLAYDETLLECARTQWQFGDWQSLSKLNRATLQHHPDRAKIALLAAAGRLQTGQDAEARQYIRLAQDWGASNKLISQILIAGAHNSIGRAATIGNQPHLALHHFESAIQIGTPGSVSRLLTQARIGEQLGQLGLNAQGGYHNSIISAVEPAAESSIHPTRNTHQIHTDEVKLYVEYAFKIPFTIQSQLPFEVGFNASNPAWMEHTDQGLLITTDAGKPLYIVSNETGDFQKVPAMPQLHFIANTLYRLKVTVPYDGDIRPVLWIFQYAAGKKIDGNSFPIDSDQVEITFRTLAEMDVCALGLRLSGQGKLLLHKTRFELSRMTDEERTRQLEDQVANLQMEQQKQKKNNLQQIQAFMRLQHYLGQENVLPEMHGWPISPDFGVKLITLIEQNSYDAVIEFGSGTSTLILAKALQRKSQRSQTTPAPLLSFDHLQYYRDQTQNLLQGAELANNTRIVLAPLVPWKDAEGQAYAYYSCDSALQTLKDQIKGHPCGQLKLLVIVDGPPAATGMHARYPAQPAVFQVFGTECHYHFLMDDYIRIDEQQIVHRWQSELEAKHILTRLTEYNTLEKQACLLEVNHEP